MTVPTALSIDPGKARLGLALWDDNCRELIEAAYVEIPEANGRTGLEAWRPVYHAVDLRLDRMGVGSAGLAIVHVAYEYFRVYDDHRVGYQDDILQLAGAMGALSAVDCLPDGPAYYTGYDPGEWTSSRPKTPNQQRIWRRLSDEEKTAVEGTNEIETKLADRKTESLGKHSEAVDAVGVGLYHYRRL